MAKHRQTDQVNSTTDTKQGKDGGGAASTYESPLQPEKRRGHPTTGGEGDRVGQGTRTR